MLRTFDTLPTDFRLSVSYVARVIRIDAPDEPDHPDVLTAVRGLVPTPVPVHERRSTSTRRRRYDERAEHLALGVEPRDALPTGGSRTASRCAASCSRSRSALATWRPGETLTGALPRMPRHHGGRFAIRYDEDARR